MGRSKLAKAGRTIFRSLRTAYLYLWNIGLSDSDFGFEASDCRIDDFVGFGFGSDWNFVFGFGFGFRIEKMLGFGFGSDWKFCRIRTQSDNPTLASIRPQIASQILRIPKFSRGKIPRTPTNRKFQFQQLYYLRIE